MIKDIDIFKYTDYKKYLLSLSGGQNQRTGFKSLLAKHINCKSAYITAILDGSANLSLEQAETINAFLNHTRQEGDYFFLLVQKERAGTHTLKKYFLEKMNVILNDRLNLTKRLGQQNSLSEKQRNKFYSAWYYQAIHIALTIPEWQTLENICNRLGLTKKKATEALDFLIEIGLVIKTQNKYQTTESQIRLSNDADQINQHHTNWRVQAIESLSNTKFLDWHYSGVLSLSEKDVRAIKERLLDQLQSNLQIVKSSKEEMMYCLNIDFFNLNKQYEE